MSQTPDQIANSMIATLNSTIPGLSLGLGTPERKIVDAVATEISKAYVGNYLSGSLLDIDSMSGLQLEQFVGIFGFGRLLGKAAVGTVQLTLSVAQTSDITFAQGTQFYTQPNMISSSVTLYYASTQTVVLTAGNLSCSIPVQCTTVGTSGNVPPGSITYMGTVVGNANVTNLSAMTGGTDTETDQELRQRFKDTLLRNIAGTSDFYEALTQQNNAVSRTVVYGPVSLYKTQISVPSASMNIPINSSVKYAWPAMESVFADLSQPTETFYSPIYDYNYVGGTTPTFTTVAGGALTAGDIVDLEFQYVTNSSRNNPLNGITNKVDIFTDGVNPISVTEAMVVSTDVLTTTSSSPLYTGNFVRVGPDAGSPTAGNRFMGLGSVPVISFPSTITVGTTIYNEGTDYWLLADANTSTNLAGSHLETSGIEWASTGAASNTALTLTYVYNNVPEVLNALIGASKQITTDALVHQADFVYIQPCLSIEYTRSYSPSVVNTAIANALQTYFTQMPFGAMIYLSQLTMFIQQTLGVASVSITTSAQNATSYGVRLFASSEDTTPASTQTSDFQLNDNQLAIYQGVLITRMATGGNTG